MLISHKTWQCFASLHGFSLVRCFSKKTHRDGWPGPKSGRHTQTGASVSCRPSLRPQHHNLFQYQPIQKKGHIFLSWPHPIVSNVCERGNQTVTLIAASSESKRRYNFTSGETEQLSDSGRILDEHFKMDFCGETPR